MLGERLRAARLMAGLSQGELAERAGVTKMAISKYERGKMLPSSRVLMQLGSALDRKVEYFLRPVHIKVESAVHRERAGRSRRDREAVYARVAECVERYLDIEAILGINSTFDMPQIEHTVRSLDDVERVASLLRQTWDLGQGPIVDLTKVLEDQGIKICLVPGDVGFDALLVLLEDGSRVIAVQDGVPGDRLRFSLAHELGHLILGHAGELSKEDEKAASRFAGAFLVPEPTARRELAKWEGWKRTIWHLVLLKQQYGLSIQGWIVRAYQLGAISQVEYQQLFKRIRRSGWHRQEPGEPYPEEKPMRMERLVNVALMADVISEAKAAEILRISIAQLG